MLGSIFKDCYILRQEMVELYWILLTPVTLGTMILEFYKQTLNFREILKRIVISITLVIGFEYITEIIALVSDGIVDKIGGMDHLADVLEHVLKEYQEKQSALSFLGRLFLFDINLILYFFTLLSFYLMEIISQVLYIILYIISPLAFLCFVPSETKHISVNIFKGITKIAIWRIMWTILGLILFEMVKSPITGPGNFVIILITNICIALAMLFVPFFTSSILGDGGGGMSARILAFGASKVLSSFKRSPIPKKQPTPKSFSNINNLNQGDDEREENIILPKTRRFRRDMTAFHNRDFSKEETIPTRSRRLDKPRLTQSNKGLLNE